MWNAGLIVLSLLAPLSTSASLKCSDYFFLSSDVIDLHRSYLLKIANDPDETAWLPPTVHHSRILLRESLLLSYEKELSLAADYKYFIGRLNPQQRAKVNGYYLVKISRARKESEFFEELMGVKKPSFIPTLLNFASGPVRLRAPLIQREFKD